MSTKANGQIVSAVGITHTPGLGDQMYRPDSTQMARILDGFSTVSRQIADARPEVVIAFVNDHFDMFTLRNMPGFAIALGSPHWGPTPQTEAWIQMKRAEIPGNPELAHDICRSLTDGGFELYRTESAEFVHNLLIPKKYLWPDLDIPVVPIFINCLAPPLPSWRRAYELGQAVRQVIDRRTERVALLASGGISHWPPITVDDETTADPLMKRVQQFQLLGWDVLRDDPTLPLDLLQREKEMADSGRSLINVEWDRDILRRLAEGDTAYLTRLDHAQVNSIGGSGAAEMLLWVALMGAMNGAKGEVVMYEPVKEWMGGVGLISYAKTLSQAS
ncbi:hypothetical protein [Bradyrhizobium erythrophlei]|uniref:2,3-dihydroxyphenylpropionate 1,2-dioxygenase n=1 Tax=Bradyrhizobium erythrophlei TaxID=1437360 RepID=A0A1H4Z2L6_9BRAD|nr:hypothetical protein [Bradyrhizobium erythrophlei]SED23664.1 2,3-dihydroxyphenylpropionate 1,2-dioxygenase [Bradyrhizobium erythrophlei]